mmetsp:Transcript_11958/g.39359  ORF Transcript_11958/g.39359 Transcript_11958/m.39359 type:complete len:238 (+) Transcript_11958:1658-2371(+)
MWATPFEPGSDPGRSSIEKAPARSTSCWIEAPPLPTMKRMYSLGTGTSTPCGAAFSIRSRRSLSSLTALSTWNLRPSILATAHPPVPFPSPPPLVTSSTCTDRTPVRSTRPRVATCDSSTSIGTSTVTISKDSSLCSRMAFAAAIASALPVMRTMPELERKSMRERPLSPMISLTPRPPRPTTNPRASVGKSISSRSGRTVILNADSSMSAFACSACFGDPVKRTVRCPGGESSRPI